MLEDSVQGLTDELEEKKLLLQVRLRTLVLEYSYYTAAALLGGLISNRCCCPFPPGALPCAAIWRQQELARPYMAVLL